MDEEKFIILITGGRGSGKSFSTSTFLERLTFEYNKEMGLAHTILLCRYTMTSAGISVIPEFTEKIDLDGTNEFFRTTKTDVVNTMTGARVMFRGIHTSSGNQTAKLKSIQGMTTFVCDEAEEWTSFDDFEKIMLSIRQKGLQNRIIIIMNPADTNHFVYDKYIKDTHKLVEYDGAMVQISTHPNVLHIHTSYLDNLEHLDEKFLAAAREMKEKDPDRYAHVFMGRWDDVAEGAVFKTFSIVDEFPEDCDNQGLGMDFGYFPDPSAVIRCGTKGKKLYLDEVGWGQGWHAPQAAECLNQYPDLFTYGECADERFTQDIAHLGPIIYRIEKGPGSIMAGINGLLEYEICITKRSIHLEHEARNYVWAKDINGNYLQLPEDHDNHCFVAGTRVRTENGEKNIEDINVGDMVWTSGGLREVLTTYDNGIKDVIKVRITLENEAIEITATPDHKIKTTKGWKQLKDLTPGDILFVFKSSMVKSSIFTQEKNISQGVAKDFTEKFGDSIMEKSPKGTTFITRMKTRGIMTSLTLSVLRVTNTLVCMLKSIFKTRSTSKNLERISTVLESLLISGTVRKRGANGIENTGNKLRPTCSTPSVRATGAEKSLNQRTRKTQSSVQTSVRQRQDTIVELTTKQEFASNAEETSRATDTQGLFSVQGAVQQPSGIYMEQTVQGVEILWEGSRGVYNIAVNDIHEFFANDILVSNCWDAVRYWFRGKIQGKILKPRATTKEQLGIY